MLYFFQTNYKFCEGVKSEKQKKKKKMFITAAQTSKTSSYLSGSELKMTPLLKPVVLVAAVPLLFRDMFFPQQLLKRWDAPG